MPDTEPNASEPVRYIFLNRPLEITRAVLRWIYTAGIFGGCSYLVFWRGESGWLYLLATMLMIFRRGL